MPRLSTPPLTGVEAWAEPAEPAEFAHVAAFVVSVCEPGASPARTATLTNLLMMQGYTRAELLLVARTAPQRPMYGDHVRPDVLHQIVAESRDLRTRLARPVSYDEMVELCDRAPEVSPSDFGVCGYGTGRDADRPLFRYTPESGPHRHAPVPALADPEHAQPGARSGLARLDPASLATKPTDR